jgi:hypothetical protein
VGRKSWTRNFSRPISATAERQRTDRFQFSRPRREPLRDATAGAPCGRPSLRALNNRLADKEIRDLSVTTANGGALIRWSRVRAPPAPQPNIASQSPYSAALTGVGVGSNVENRYLFE